MHNLLWWHLKFCSYFSWEHSVFVVLVLFFWGAWTKQGLKYMQYCILCASHIGMNSENACCALLVSHVPSKALLEVFLLLQGISLDDSNVSFAIHSCVKLCHNKKKQQNNKKQPTKNTLEWKNKRKRNRKFLHTENMSLLLLSIFILNYSAGLEIGWVSSLLWQHKILIMFIKFQSLCWDDSTLLSQDWPYGSIPKH